MQARWLGGVVALWMAAAGCAHTRAVETAAPSTDRTHGGTAVLQLFDGSPVSGVPVAVSCGGVRERGLTDARGRFPVSGSHCTVWAEGLPAPLPVGDNVLRGGRVAVVPPRVMLVLEGEHGQVTIDSALGVHCPAAMRCRWVPTAHLTAEGLTVEGRTIPRAALESGEPLTLGGVALKVARLQRLPWRPVAWRGQPGPDDVARAELLDGSGAVVRLTPAPRHVVVLPGPEHEPARVKEELDHLTSRFGHTGLAATLLLLRSQPWPVAPEHDAATSAVHVARATVEARWALRARPGQVLVLDRGMHVVHRARLPGRAHLDAIVAHLERSWPPISATARISVAASASVREAEAKRLQARAGEAVGARRYAEAIRLLDRVLELIPDQPQARRQRTMARVRMGDLSGAVREVTWWRSAYGDESADELMAEIRKISSR